MVVKKDITKQYLKSSIQFSHSIIESNKKLIPYLLNKKNELCIFDLVKASNFLKLAGNILQKKAEKGHKFLFVGTDKFTSDLLVKEAKRTKNYYINFRWLGGMITNWETLQLQINSLNVLEKVNIKLMSNNLNKKKISLIKKKIKKLNNFFGGVKSMKTFPQCVIFINNENHISAIRECLKLGITTIAIIDSNCNYDLIPYPILANTYSTLSIKYLINYLGQRILNGYTNRKIIKN